MDVGFRLWTGGATPLLVGKGEGRPSIPLAPLVVWKWGRTPGAAVLARPEFELLLLGLVWGFCNPLIESI